MANPGLHLTVPCVVCNDLYQQSRSDQLYCSPKCGSRAWRDDHHVEVVISCAVCGNPFVRRKEGQVNCTWQCAEKADKARLQAKNTGAGKGWAKGAKIAPRLSCIECGGQFYAPPCLIRRGGGKFCSKDCQGRFTAKNPELFPQTKTRRGRGGKRDDLGGRYFRSCWEANWARYLNWLIENGQIRSWEYETETYEFHAIKRGSRFYTPDFRIANPDSSIERHEIKGYMDAASQTKLDRMALYYPESPITLIDKARYYAVAKVVASLIPTWERSK